MRVGPPEEPVPEAEPGRGLGAGRKPLQPSNQRRRLPGRAAQAEGAAWTRDVAVPPARPEEDSEGGGGWGPGPQGSVWGAGPSQGVLCRVCGSD